MADNAKKVAIMATDYFEEPELLSPMQALEDAGIAVEVLAPHEGSIKGLKHVESGQSVAVTRTIAEADPGNYDALVLPGGVVNADKLRMDDGARAFARAMLSSGKPVAAICHAPWLLVSAGLLRDMHATSYFTLQDDIRNAGGNWSDEEVVKDGTLITSRTPNDLPAFNKALLEALGAV